MMTFHFREQIPHTAEEKQKAINFFVKYIGEVKPQFDEYDVAVEINMDAKEGENKYIFSSNKIMIGDLIWKVQEYRKKNSFHN
jgi:hypothetical protein